MFKKGKLMKLNELELSSFARAELNTYNLETLNLDNELALRSIRDDLRVEIEDLNCFETMKARFDYFKVKGATPGDYQERVLNFDGEKKVIYGIRNFGGDPSLPFIHLIPNFKVDSKELAISIYKRVEKSFQCFSPLYLSFQSNSKLDVDFIGSVHILEKAKRISDSKKWEQEDLLELIQIENNSYYEWYKKGYENFHAEIPSLSRKVTLNSMDTMSESLEQGLLYYVKYKGEIMGLIAAERSPFLGHLGLYFNEIFISKEYKGKGLAKAIQRKFVESFTTGEEYIWGTIDLENIPSLKTALSNGRRPVRYECFINI